MSDISLTYKIIILELLNRVNYPLSNAQITDFFTESGITDYFTTQEAISSLIDAGMLEVIHSNNNTLYQGNEQAWETLRLYQEKVSSNIKDEMISYLNKNGLSMKQSNSLFADYQHLSSGGYLCSLRMLEEDAVVIDLALRVTSEAAAEAVCTNWKVRCGEVYEAVVDRLIG